MTNVDFRDVQPGLVSAILFVLLDLFLVGVLDVTLTRIVCIGYYMKVNHGKPLDVRSADVPIVSSFLIGKRFSLVNMFAVFCKVGILVIIFVANAYIDDKTWSALVTRSATFSFDASDAFINANENRVLTVARRDDRMRVCRVLEGTNGIEYYPIRFNLTDNLQLEDDYGQPSVNETAQFSLNDSTIVCLIPDNTPDDQIVEPYALV